nr:MAG TPA: Protein of unknown function (DUF2634) [Caudoviricetes sp.]
MATLPQGSALQTTITPQRQPSRTWYINKTTNRIEGEVENRQAAHQAVQIILNTERFRWQIYKPYSGVEWGGLIGQDPGYVGANLLRRVREALLVDDRVRDVTDFAFTVQGDRLSATMTVQTVYGNTQTTVEVNLA